MAELLKGELTLTIDILLGLLLGKIIIRLRVPEFLMKHFPLHHLPAVTCTALAASLGSSKTGAAIISSALSANKITERSAIWSVLMLPLPSYLRRWPSTMIMSVSIAGKAGGIFALSLLLRSTARFMIAFMFLKKESVNNENFLPEFSSINSSENFLRMLKTLPLAWIFFAITYSLVPVINNALKLTFAGSVLPLSGWAVSAASMGHVSAALALAGGALASGELNVSQAVFALILGSGLGTATRILRQNAGYYFGLFPARTAQKMLLMNFVTIMPLIILNLFFAYIALSF